MKRKRQAFENDIREEETACKMENDRNYNANKTRRQINKN